MHFEKSLKNKIKYLLPFIKIIGNGPHTSMEIKSKGFNELLLVEDKWDLKNVTFLQAIHLFILPRKIGKEFDKKLDARYINKGVPSINAKELGLQF